MTQQDSHTKRVQQAEVVAEKAAAGLIDFPAPDVIYDSFMIKIEPELTTKNSPLLTEKYKNETPEENDARNKRYFAAYAEYDRQYGDWIGKLKKGVVELKRITLEVVEGHEDDKKDEILASLEAQFDTGVSPDTPSPA